MLCTVVKHLGSRRAFKKWGKTLDYVSCSPLHFFRALPLPACFRLLYLLIRLLISACARCMTWRANFVRSKDAPKQLARTSLNLDLSLMDETDITTDAL